MALCFAAAAAADHTDPNRPRDTQYGPRKMHSTAFPDGACPHVAVLLSHSDEVAPALASFYALGAKRNGWLYYRALAGCAAADRAALIAAGLDVDGLEAQGRMVVSEMHPDISVEDYVQ